MVKLNPAAVSIKRRALKSQAAAIAKKSAAPAKLSKKDAAAASKKKSARKAIGKTFYATMSAKTE